MGKYEFLRHSLVKIQRSKELSGEIFSQCFEYVISEDRQIILQLGSLIGEFANNLRAALNYASVNILRKNLMGILNSREIKRLGKKPNLDFPWGLDKAGFDKNITMRLLSEKSIGLYNAFENFQPYYRQNEWLAHLMKLSNRDKHEIVNKVKSPTASDFAAETFDEQQMPFFLGGDLIMPSQLGIRSIKLPCYFEPLHAFATTNHKWLLFMVPMGQRYYLDLISWTRETPLKVEFIVNYFYENFGEKEDKNNLQDDVNQLIDNN